MTEREIRYFEYLKQPGFPYKLPYIKTVQDLTGEIPVEYSTLVGEDSFPDKSTTWGQLRDTAIKVNNKTNEKSIQSYQRSLPIAKIGRLRGNMEYLEDCWNVQIQPLTFKYAYAGENNLETTGAMQTKIRDKYLKIRVRYDGKQYVMVNAIKTNYTISYA